MPLMKLEKLSLRLVAAGQGVLTVVLMLGVLEGKAGTGTTSRCFRCWPGPSSACCSGAIGARAGSPGGQAADLRLGRSCCHAGLPRQARVSSWKCCCTRGGKHGRLLFFVVLAFILGFWWSSPSQRVAKGQSKVRRLRHRRLRLRRP